MRPGVQLRGQVSPTALVQRITQLLRFSALPRLVYFAILLSSLPHSSSRVTPHRPLQSIRPQAEYHYASDLSPWYIHLEAILASARCPRTEPGVARSFYCTATLVASEVLKRGNVPREALHRRRTRSYPFHNTAGEEGWGLGCFFGPLRHERRCVRDGNAGREESAFYHGRR
ncbi:hypothetical protein BJ546DRAFT_54179 [Cryomyces antarcticus]